MSWNRGVIAKVNAAAADAVERAAELLQDTSDALVPDLSGELQSTSQVTVERGQAAAAVSYDTDYAPRVHEDLTARHDDGNAKFLENALYEDPGTYLDVMATGVRRGLL